MFKVILRRLYNAYLYAKQGWKSSNCDHDYLLQDIQFKLKLMARAQLNKDNMMYHKDAFGLAKEMMRAVKYIQEIRDEKYIELGEKELEDKYGEIRMFTEDHSRDGGCQLLVLREKEIEQPELKKHIQRDTQEVRMKAIKEQNKHNNTAFTYIADNFRKWWM